MLYATMKQANIDTLIVFDGEDCTCEILKSVLGEQFQLTPQHIVDNQVINTTYEINNLVINKGDILTLSSGEVVNVEVLKLMRFFDTKSSYTLVRNHAIGVEFEDCNDGGFPQRLVSNGVEINLGDWLVINERGVLSKAIEGSYNTHSICND